MREGPRFLPWGEGGGGFEGGLLRSTGILEKVQEGQALGKGACAQGQVREILHGRIDSKVREEVVMRPRGSEKTKAWRVSWEE